MMFNRNGKEIMEKEIEYRKKLPLTNVEDLAKNFEFSYDSEILKGEIFLARYGMNRILKKYAGLPYDYNIHALFEHGIIYTDYVGGAFRIHEYLPSIVASQFRIKILEKQKGYKGAYAIGPYIHYANSLLSKEEIKSEKERLGRTLLVFPSHSIDCAVANFNENTFLTKIKEIGKDFDSVRICMYNHDVILKRHIPYLKEGFEVVTAGQTNDYYFLPRLKSIIQLSDMTMANDIGTHLGYAIYLDKPHYLIKQNVSFDVTNKIVEKNEKEAEERENNSSNTHKIINLFSDYEERISKDQYELISYLWGFNEVKTPSELKNLIFEINNDYSNMKYYLSCIKRTKDLLFENLSLRFKSL